MTQASPPMRYCSHCGDAFEAPAMLCPFCGAAWVEPTLRDDIPATAALLSAIQRWIQRGLADAASLERVRDEYEFRLARMHRREASAIEPTSRVVAAPAAAAAPPRPALRREDGPRLPPFDLRDRVARRQADVLLYLGAFLLVVSALIFVSRQSETLTTGWRVGLLATYTVGFLATGWLLRRWPRVREAGPVFLAIGALFTPLNFLLIYTEVLEDRGVEASAIWFAGAAYSTAFYGVLFRGGFGRLYGVPAAIAVHITWGALFFVLNIPGEWFGPWWMAFAVMATVALWQIGWRNPAGAIYPLAIASMALLVSHVVADRSFEFQNGPLPVSYALLTAGVSYYGSVRREPLTLLATAAGVIVVAIAALWAFGFEADWYAYPAVAMAVLAVGSRRYWVHWSAPLSHSGWAFAGVGALAPLLFLDAYREGAHGLVAFAAGSAVLAGIGWRNIEDGVLADLWARRSTTRFAERTLFGWAAFAMLLVAIAYAQREFGIASPDTGWSYALVAGASILAVASLAGRDVRVFVLLLPPFAAAIVLSLQRWDLYTGHDAVFLGLPALELLVAFAVTRRWALTVGAAGLAIVSAAAAWEAAGWEFWTLAVAYGAGGLVLFAALTPLRRYEAFGDPVHGERPVSAAILSWGVLLAAPAMATIALGLSAETASDAPATIEYRVLVGLVAAVGLVLAAEGWRLSRWDVQVPTLALVAGALAASWPAFDFEPWTLSPVYGVVGLLLMVALASRRRYVEGDREAISVVIISWGLIAAAAAAAIVALSLRAEPGYDAPATIEYRSLVAVVAAVGAVLAAEGLRIARWDVQVPALVLIAGAVAASWPAFGFDWWTLAALYGVAGAGLLLTLGSRRRYGSGDRVTGSILILSWGLLAAAPLAAWYALELRVDEGARPTVSLVEYRALIATVLLFAPALAYEGNRLGQRSLYLVSSAVGMTALEMAIATVEPSNVQAYTVPAAIYTAAVGLAIRRSDMLIDPHLRWHELITVVGAALLVLPQAEQGFEPGGSRWALVLLVEGAVFLGVSFALGARWLAVSGVLTISGVAIRALWVSRDAVPYWLMLGLAGLLLLAAGFVLLLQREWWDRVRARMIGWWAQRVLLGTAPDDIHLLALLSALAPALVITALPLANG